MLWNPTVLRSRSASPGPNNYHHSAFHPGDAPRPALPLGLMVEMPPELIYQSPRSYGSVFCGGSCRILTIDSKISDDVKLFCGSDGGGHKNLVSLLSRSCQQGGLNSRGAGSEADQKCETPLLSGLGFHGF